MSNSNLWEGLLKREEKIGTELKRICVTKKFITRRSRIVNVCSRSTFRVFR